MHSYGVRRPSYTAPFCYFYYHLLLLVCGVSFKPNMITVVSLNPWMALLEGWVQDGKVKRSCAYHIEQLRVRLLNGMRIDFI